MWWRRRRGGTRAVQAAATLDAFRRVAAHVEEAKDRLLLGVPSGRAPRLPLAEAIAAFEAELRKAAEAMPRWRAPAMEAERRACDEAIRESLDRVERLRLGDPPEGYEELVPLIDAVLEPLDAFGRAARRYRRGS